MAPTHPEHKDLRTSPRKKTKLAAKCFPKTAEKKQMRDVSAEPAVSTLKSVRANDFLEGAPLVPRCCQRRLQASALTPSERIPFPFSFSHSIIPPLSPI